MMNLFRKKSKNSKSETSTSIEHLPAEVLTLIFAYLSIKELGTVCLVKKSWKEISEADQIWRRFIPRFFSSDNQCLIKEGSKKDLIRRATPLKVEKVQNSQDVRSFDDYLFFKVLLLGDVCVGKRSIVERFKGGEFNPTPLALSIIWRMNFEVMSLSIRDNPTKLKIGFADGTDRDFKANTYAHFMDSDIVIFVCDVTNRASFDSLTKWFDIANKRYIRTDKEQKIIVIGNKCDLESGRVVSDEEIQKFAKEHGCSSAIVSARSGAGIDEAFFQPLRELYQQNAQKIEERNAQAEENKGVVQAMLSSCSVM